MFAYLVELEFSARTSIFSFEKDRYVLYPAVADKYIKNPTISAIKALPRYFTASVLLSFSFVSNFITPFLAKVELQTGAVYQQLQWKSALQSAEQLLIGTPVVRVIYKR